MSLQTVHPSRRQFLKGSAALAGIGLLSSLPVGSGVYAGGDDVIKIALVGCGSRGAGAAVNALQADRQVRLVAMADAFWDKIDETYANLMKIPGIRDAVLVPEEHKFTGFEGYKQAIGLADVVLLVTPPAFRPLHFEAVVQAGKHVFMEKPLASDAPGIRQILKTGKLAEAKRLKVLVGLQNRYDPAFIEFVDQIKSGTIGDIVSATDYYLIGPVRHVERGSGQTEMEYQMRNWRYFNWLWAGSPAALQIHNTDVVNWVKGSYPVRAQGMGGRNTPGAPGYGDIFDHFFIEYEYADGMKLNSQIRSISGTWNKGGANFVGTKGKGDATAKILSDHQGNQQWRSQVRGNSYQLEHERLFSAIRNGTPLNDTDWGAKSTMTTILGRMAAHSGKLIEWDDALQSTLSILPERMEWDAVLPSMPDAEGNYPIPVPGKSEAL